MDRREVMAWRRTRRAELIAARLAMSRDLHRAAGAAILERLVALFTSRAERLIGAYWPFRHEFNAVPFMEWAIAAGREVALPVVIAKGLPLEFRRWQKDTKLASGVYDIPYPAEGAPVRPDALVVPVVGFDDGGYRLGYGGGFYDRTLATYAEKPLCVGVGFEFAHHTTIFPLPHDIPMDYIVTETALYRREAGGLAPV